jgi:mitochondrial fission protein ELM1
MLRISLICDGKAGDLAQLRGLAEALHAIAACETTFHTIAPRALYALLMPYGPPDPRDEACYVPPFPDMAIGSGRRAVAYLRAIKKRYPQSFIAFLKDPRYARDEFDFLWLPSHDRADGPNMFKTATSPHGLSAEALAQARLNAAHRFPTQGKPRAVVLLGGPTKGWDYPLSLGQQLAQKLKLSAQIYELMILPSRRTPEAFLHALAHELEGHASYVWDRISDNPYRELMASADVIVAPGDSHNMVSEALATGGQVFIFAPQGANPKLDAFRAEIITQGHARMFNELPAPADITKREPYDATRLIAQALMRAFNSRAASRG